MKNGQGQCEFEEWDPERKEIGHCKEPATHSVAGHQLCEFHARYVHGLRTTTSAAQTQPVLEIQE
jgi:hypothetical protein